MFYFMHVLNTSLKERVNDMNLYLNQFKTHHVNMKIIFTFIHATQIQLDLLSTTIHIN